MQLKKIIEGEAYDRLPIDVPTYTAIEAPPSLLPAKKYCDLTGLEAKYTDPKTRFCTMAWSNGSMM
jgi:INO80 complex subunit C